VKKGLPALCLGLTVWLSIPLIEAKAKPEFENQYLKIRLSPGWTVAASGDQVLNLVREKYILSIDPTFTHASGIIGGRFSEFASGRQSIEAVMANVDQPAGGFECAEMPADAIVVSESLSLANLYTDSSKVGNGCVFPSSGRPVWFGSVFSGPGSESDYAITLTYSSNKVNALPSKDSPELRRVFGEVREMLETLQLKPPIMVSKIDPESSSPGARVTLYGRGFNLFNHGAEVRFKQFPNDPMSTPVIAADGSSLTFEVPNSIDTISCPPGRMDVNEWCVPTPSNHIDVADCPSKPDGSTNFCGKPMPPGTYQLWVTSGEVNSDFVSLTVTPREYTAVSIVLLYPNSLVSEGDVVAIRGSGFSATGNTVKIGSAVVSGVSSPDGKTIMFHAPAPAGITFIHGIKIYGATVINTKGQSNSISFGYR
jgi:hypothetical protein